MPADDTATWTETELSALREEFGDAYREYARHVGRVLPRILPSRSLPRRGAFHWSQVLSNNEHVTVLFTLAMTLLFAARLVWGG